ncbi:MAG: acetyl-CoA C-acyltransferase [Acidimicrobiales bacterium]
MAESFIFDAVRTPVGHHGGALAGVRPDDLAATALTALGTRNPELDPGAVEDVWLGAANQSGEDNRNVARMATLLAGWPVTVPGATVNRLCGSGLEAVIAASRAIASGDLTLAVAGGVESMSRAPWVLLKPGRAYARGNETLHSTTLGWRMVNPRHHDRWTVSLGEATELLVGEFGISRESQDEFAASSHRRAAAAWAAGHFDAEITQVPGAPLAIDESIRPETSVEALAGLRPVFRPEGTVTAGNASPLNDGAAALLIGSADAGRELGRDPIARIAARATSALEPHRFGLGPVDATRAALTRAGLSAGDLDAVELNEAFAGQALAVLHELGEMDPAIVNPLGGAIALGHPLGASGARILTTLLWHLRRTGGRYGLAAMCIGVGQGIAVVIERV